MNKKILTIAITCSFCFLLITNYVVADKPEWAGKPEGIIKQQADDLPPLLVPPLKLEFRIIQTVVT